MRIYKSASYTKSVRWKPSVLPEYDSRNMSEEFCKETSELPSKGFPPYCGVVTLDGISIYRTDKLIGRMEVNQIQALQQVGHLRLSTLSTRSAYFAVKGPVVWAIC